MACRWPRFAASGRASSCSSVASRPRSSRSGCGRSASAASIRASGASCTSSGCAVFDMRFIDEMGMRRAMELALEDLEEDTHLHVSFDVDVLDPEIAPGVGTTVPGGMSYREAQLCMEMIADTGLVGSLDIMELNPGAGCAQQDRDARGGSRRIAVRQEHAHAASRERGSRRARSRRRRRAGPRHSPDPAPGRRAWRPLLVFPAVLADTSSPLFRGSLAMAASLNEYASPASPESLRARRVSTPCGPRTRRYSACCTRSSSPEGRVIAPCRGPSRWSRARVRGVTSGRSSMRSCRSSACRIRKASRSCALPRRCCEFRTMRPRTG